MTVIANRMWNYSLTRQQAPMPFAIALLAVNISAVALIPFYALINFVTVCIGGLVAGQFGLTLYELGSKRGMFKDPAITIPPCSDAKDAVFNKPSAVNPAKAGGFATTSIMIGIVVFMAIAVIMVNLSGKKAEAGQKVQQEENGAVAKVKKSEAPASSVRVFATDTVTVYSFEFDGKLWLCAEASGRSAPPVLVRAGDAKRK